MNQTCWLLLPPPDSVKNGQVKDGGGISFTLIEETSKIIIELIGFNVRSIDVPYCWGPHNGVYTIFRDAGSDGKSRRQTWLARDVGRKIWNSLLDLGWTQSLKWRSPLLHEDRLPESVTLTNRPLAIMTDANTRSWTQMVLEA